MNECACNHSNIYWIQYWKFNGFLAYETFPSHGIYFTFYLKWIQSVLQDEFTFVLKSDFNEITMRIVENVNFLSII